MKGISAIWIVARKEFVEMIRDRKTLFFMLVLPVVIIPLLGNVVVDFTLDVAKEEASKTLEYAIFDDAGEPEVEAAIERAPAFAKVEIGPREAIRAAIAADEIDFALVIPEVDRTTEPLTVELHFDNASQTSSVSKRVQGALLGYGEELRDAKLAEVGATTAEARKLLLEPMAVVERGTATDREVAGEIAGGILPYIFIMFALLGALYPAIDLGAGEKERGTLETLLLAPIRRRDIVLGKFLVIFGAGVISATLVVITITVWIAAKMESIGGGAGELLSTIGPLDMVLAWVVVLPITAVFAAILLSISIYAKSFKEAQSYSAPLQIFAILPAMAPMLPGVELGWGTALIPVTNVSLAIKEIIKGTIDPMMLVVIIASSSVIAGVLLGLCTWWFSREEVLFRQ